MNWGGYCHQPKGIGLGCPLTGRIQLPGLCLSYCSDKGPPTMAALHKLSLTLILLAWSMNLAAKEIVRIAVGEWPPYLSQTSPHFGVAAHIVEEAFQATGMDVEYQFLPWARVAVYVENGQFDASILWVKTEERETRYLFSDVLLEGEAVFFYNRDNPLIWQNMEDLSGKRFGGLLSASYPWFDAARAAGIPMQMEQVPTERQNFAMLLSQRIDAYAMDKLVGMHILQQDFPSQAEQITFDPRPVETWPYRLIFTRSPRGETLVEQFNRGLEIIELQGTVRVHLNNVANGVYLPVNDKTVP